MFNENEIIRAIVGIFRDVRWAMFHENIAGK